MNISKSESRVTNLRPVRRITPELFHYQPWELFSNIGVEPASSKEGLFVPKMVS
jgi:hypothetical protein